MKISTPIVALSMLALTALIAGCAPALTNSEVPNALTATPNTLHIAMLGDTASSSVRLLCGCPFSLAAKPLSGDTAYVRIALSATNPSSTHTLFAFGAAGTPKGSYQARFALSTPDDAKLFDTVTASLNVP